MRFLFVDRILELEKGKSAVGIKNVSFSDECLVNIVPGFPVMPRSLTIEVISQLISWLVICTKDFAVKPVAVMTDSTKFFEDVRPGDQMLIKAEIKSLHDEDALCAGSVEVDGKVVSELENGVCAFIPMEELEYVDMVKKRAYSLMGSRDLQQFIAETDLSIVEPGMFDNDSFFNLNLVDRVEDLKTGEYIVGVKSMTMTEDFIVDHFPRRHVMPGTMIIESLVQLAEKLVQETIKNSSDSFVKILLKENKKIKFRKYVRPGDQIVMNVKLIDISDNTALVKAKVTVGDKLATSAQMEFQIIKLYKN